MMAKVLTGKNIPLVAACFDGHCFSSLLLCFYVSTGKIGDYWGKELMSLYQ
jgi:hypothetical protein